MGLGKTGVSCARFLQNQGRPFLIMDSREQPPGLQELNRVCPGANIRLGKIDQEVLASADEIFLSPGLSQEMPEIKFAAGKGARIRGDVDLFAEKADAPIIGITGSNGKSTVTTLVGMMAERSGISVGVGGNIGTPALDLIGQGHTLYVLELSSFQLETTENLKAACVTLLNISEDHMDRYPNKLAYLQAKQRIFRGAEKVVVNDEDALTQPLASRDMKIYHYGLDATDLNKFSVDDADGERWIMHSFEPVMPVRELALQGRHNLINVLAALTIGSAMGFELGAMKSVLREFNGLPHRCQHIRTLDNVRFINDSKGTNVGACVTAISSFGETASGVVILIAGGESKEAELDVLSEPMRRYGKLAVLFGRDADKLQRALASSVSVKVVQNMSEAVRYAHKNADPGDGVLLSPACSSLDMYENFEQRGDDFVAEVHAL